MKDESRSIRSAVCGEEEEKRGVVLEKTLLTEVLNAAYVVVATFVKPDWGKQNASIWLWDTERAAPASRGLAPSAVSANRFTAA